VPGLVDCHTHVCFGGWRADEFEQRSRGAGYLEIARAGGGIMRTVAQTRAATDDELLELVLERLAAMARLGVTTAECKSGYGLSTRDEIRILEVYKRAAGLQPVRLVSTFLGAHVVPTEYKGRRQAYVDLICEEMIPALAEKRLATFCDVFVEEGAFSVDEARRIFRVAARHDLRPKLHVDQLSDGRGAALAAEVSAVSADHLEYSNRDGMLRMIERNVVPVTLPIASLYLRQKPMDARMWIELGAEVAVATDLNPGSAPTYHLPLAMMLACAMNGLTPREALHGATRVAARALGKDVEIGSLEPGKKADFILVDAPSVNHWVYHFRPNQVTAAWIDGNRVW
jgi:imidazolonepropionase